MNSIFKKLRKRLLEKNKAKRYLTYAVGEIFLVVIGILIALQVNNHNELRKKRKLELKYITNLRSDLLAEKSDLEKIISRRESKTASAEKMVSYHVKKEVDTLMNYYTNFANVLYWEVHHPNDKTFQELVNSGNLSIINNREIKGNLLEIENNYNQIHELREHMKEDYELFFYKEYKDIFNFSTAINAWIAPNNKHNLSEADVEKCLQNRAIENGFTLAAFNNNELGSQSKQILDIVNKTIILIDGEIDK